VSYSARVVKNHKPTKSTGRFLKKIPALKINEDYLIYSFALQKSF
jgi:hypothetical protein